MPAQNELFQYSISDVSKTLDVSTHSIRAWEKKYNLDSKRNEKEERVYDIEDIIKLRDIRDQKNIPVNFSIDEAAGRLGVSTHTLRLLESKGSFKPARNEKGHRVYSINDIEEVKNIMDGFNSVAAKPFSAGVANVISKIRALEYQNYIKSALLATSSFAVVLIIGIAFLSNFLPFSNIRGALSNRDAEDQLALNNSIKDILGTETRVKTWN